MFLDTGTYLVYGVCRMSTFSVTKRHVSTGLVHYVIERIPFISFLEIPSVFDSNRGSYVNVPIMLICLFTALKSLDFLQKAHPI